jgi:hypothetical protein
MRPVLGEKPAVLDGLPQVSSAEDACTRAPFVSVFIPARSPKPLRVDLWFRCSALDHTRGTLLACDSLRFVCRWRDGASRRTAAAAPFFALRIFPAV